MSLLLSLTGFDFSSYYSLVTSAGVSAIGFALASLTDIVAVPLPFGPPIAPLLLVVGLGITLFGVQGLRRTQSDEDRFRKQKIEAIRERRKAERARRKAEEQRREFYETVNDAVRSDDRTNPP